jgi:uncharacterized protein YidB (DUF937 family)
MSPVLMALLGLLAYKALKGRSQSPQAPAETGSDHTPPPTSVPSGQGGSLGDLLGGMLGGAGGAGPGGGSLGDLLGGILGGGGAPGGRGAAPTGGGGGLGDLLGGILGGGGPAGGRGAGPGAGGGSLGDLLGPAAGGVLGSVLGGGLRNLVQDMQANGHGREAQSWVGNGPNEDISETDLANAIGADDIDHVAQQTGVPRDQLLSELRRYLPGAIDQLTPRGQLPSEEESSQWV